jgi:hypothetical protein
MCFSLLVTANVDPGLLIPYILKMEEARASEPSILTWPTTRHPRERHSLRPQGP